MIVYTKSGVFIRDLRKDLKLKSIKADSNSSGNIYLATGDPNVADIVIRKVEEKNRVREIKAAYFQLTPGGIKKLSKRPDIKRPEVKGIIKNDKYKEGARQIFRTHITWDGDMYGIFWNEHNKDEGVKILKWVEQVEQK